MRTAHDTRDAVPEPAAEPAAQRPVRAPGAAAGLSPELIARVQRTAGNAAATALIQRERRPRTAIVYK